MKFLKRVLETVSSGLDSSSMKFEIRAPDLIVRGRRGVRVIRYLVVDEADFDVNNTSAETIKRFVEAYSSILEKLPEGSEIKVVKCSVDLRKLASKLSNEILNLKATIDVVEEPHVKRRALVKLKTLESMYEYLVRGSGIAKLNMVVKLRGQGKSVSEALSSISTLSAIVRNVLQNELRLRAREASSRDIAKIVKYEIGLSERTGIRSIVVDSYRASSLLPAPLDKKPGVEEDGVLIGIDVESEWPVVVPYGMLNKHALVLGPTGRGKTTLLASIIENVLSASEYRVLAVDFKGDLIKLLDPDLIELATPREYPINISQRPSYFETIEWSLIVSEVLSSVLKTSQERLLEALVRLSGSDDLRSSENLKAVVRDLSALSPIIEMLSDKPNYERFKEVALKSIAFDLSQRGSAYQNAYCGLMLYMYKKVALENSGPRRLVVIDEAWRISNFRVVLELVKEGRSKNVGVVLATQNPSDVPREILENVHLLMVFGSPNEDYRESVKKMLGFSHSALNKLLYLNVGEALLINSLDPHPVLVKVRPPRKLFKS